MALVIIGDFVLPRSVVQSEIMEVRSQQEQYYNTARNYHYSYKVVTSQHEFSVSEEFSSLAQENQKIEYSVSPIFKEVNWYRLQKSDEKSSFSLRIISGLVLPLMALISILVAYRTKWNMNTLVFVLQTVLIADLVYLIH